MRVLILMFWATVGGSASMAGSTIAAAPASAPGPAAAAGPSSAAGAAIGAGSHARTAAVAAFPAAPDSVSERLSRLAPIRVDDIVWLARCIYSESDRPHEQRLVAWVVRNRVETRYWGSTYRDVILEDRQFSAFNEPTPRRRRILNLTPASTYGPWRAALQIALDVYQAPASERPFPQTVRHFYSPVSMRGVLQPHWAESGVEISSTQLGVDPYRFRFFSDVDEQLDGAIASSAETESKRAESTDDGGSGFLFPVRSGSGRVARPRRPTVRRTSPR